MFKALKNAAGLKSLSLAKVSLDLDVDSQGLKCPGTGLERGTSFVSVGPGTTAIRGTATLTVHGSRPVIVSEFSVGFVAHVGMPPDMKAEIRIPAAYGRRLHEQEITFWSKPRELRSGVHSFDFVIPFWGNLPNSSRSWRGLRGLDITHKLHAICHFGQLGTAYTQAMRELVIYRHMDEEGKALLDGHWRSHQVTQKGNNQTGDWRLRVVLPTHCSLGDPLKIYFKAENVQQDKTVEATADLLSSRLIEQLEFSNDAKSSRAVGPIAGFTTVGKSNITVDEATGLVVSFDKRGSGDSRKPISQSYLSAVISTKHAQPRCTHDLVSITHFIEFRVTPDFDRALAGDIKLVLPVRLVYVPNPGSSSGSLRSISSAPLCRPRQESLITNSSGSVSSDGSSPCSDLPPSFWETLAPGSSAEHEWEAIDDYTPRLRDEIALIPGDLVTINPHDMYPDGWSRGTNLRTLETGVLPMPSVVSTASRVVPTLDFSLTVPDEGPRSPADTLPLFGSLPPRYSASAVNLSLLPPLPFPARSVSLHSGDDDTELPSVTDSFAERGAPPSYSAGLSVPTPPDRLRHRLSAPGLLSA